MSMGKHVCGRSEEWERVEREGVHEDVRLQLPGVPDFQLLDLVRPRLEINGDEILWRGGCAKCKSPGE